MRTFLYKIDNDVTERTRLCRFACKELIYRTHLIIICENLVESAVNNQVNLLSMKTITTIKSFVAALVCCIAVSGCSEKTAPEHVQAVDLGLSVKWASCNIGADSPEDFGQYFAWGETEKKTSYSERNSKT